MLKEINLQNYLFKTDIYELPPRIIRLKITKVASGNDRNFQRTQCLRENKIGGKYGRSKKSPDLRGLENFRKMRVVPFDVPGTQRGRGNPELTELLGEKCVGLDVNSMKPLDNLCIQSRSFEMLKNWEAPFRCSSCLFDGRRNNISGTENGFYPWQEGR